MVLKLFKRYKAVAYLPNLYSLLQYLLLEPYKIKDTLFFIHGEFPKLVASRLPESNFLGENFLSKSFSCLKVYLLVLFNKNIAVYLGGHLAFTNCFLRISKNPIYLEDGTASYEIQKEKRSKQKQERLLARLFKGDIYPKAGLADHVQKIYLTGILPIPEIIANKVEIINLKSLWLLKTEAQKKEICHIFLPEGFDVNLIGKYGVLLLTQPFSECSWGRFSEKEKIEVYRKLISGYNESELVIKTHPSESTNYRKYFPKAHILDISCPLELLSLMGFRANTVISVNSTSVFGLEGFQEKIISGYDVTPELKREAIVRGIYEGISNRNIQINNQNKSCENKF